MLNSVLQVSDAKGLPVFLTSSRESYNLYQSLGFVELGMWKRDHHYWATEILRTESELKIQSSEGLEEACTGKEEEEAVMMRQPNPAT